MFEDKISNEDNLIALAEGLLWSKKVDKHISDAVSPYLKPPGYFIPVFSSLKQDASGKCIMDFIDRDTKVVFSLYLSDEMIPLKTTFDKYLVDYNQIYKNSDDENPPSSESTTLLRGSNNSTIGENNDDDPPSAPGLNAVFFIQGCIDFFSNTSNAVKEFSEASLMIKIHIVVNWLVMVEGVGHDIADITKCISELVFEGSSELSRIAGTFFSYLEAFGSVFSFAVNIFNIAVDVNLMKNSPNEYERVVATVQLIVDSGFLILTSIGLISSLLGAVTLSGVLGAFGPIFAGLAIGIAGLAQSFAKIAFDASAIGKYFYTKDKAYSEGGFYHDSEHDVAVPYFGGVITKIDYMKGEVSFGNEYIYRTHHGSTGSGKIGYFFWAGDFPTIITDKSQAINIREKIGYSKSTDKLSFANTTTTVLPFTPSSYISYGWNVLPGATSRHDPGFDVLRRLEQDETFDYDFYIFPGEYIIDTISFEYQKTNIEVILDSQDRTFLVPPLNDQLSQNILNYTITSGGGTGVFILQDGAFFDIKTPVEQKDKARWVFSSSKEMDGDDVVFFTDKIGFSFGKVDITFDSYDQGTVLVHNLKEELLSVDLKNKTMTSLKEDFSKYASLSDLLKFLADHSGSFGNTDNVVTIENFKVDGKPVGTGFYLPSIKKIVYSKTSEIEIASNSSYIGHDDSYLFVYSQKDALIWSIDINTCEICNSFQLNPKGKIQGAVYKDQILYVAEKQPPTTTKEGKEHDIMLYYFSDFSKKRLVLYSFSGAYFLMRSIFNKASYPAKDLEDYIKNNFFCPTSVKSPFPNEMHQDIHTYLYSSLNMISVATSKPLFLKYWMEKQDNNYIILRPNLETPLNPKLPESHLSGESHYPIPDDLTLVSQQQALFNKTPIFFFFSKTYNALYRQQDMGPYTGTIDPNHPTTLLVDIPNKEAVSDVFSINEAFFAVSETGLIYQIDVSGNSKFAGITTQWMSSQKDWISSLVSQAKSMKISEANKIIFIIPTLNHEDASVSRSPTMWYFPLKNRFAVSNPKNLSSYLQFLGATNFSFKKIILFDEKNFELIEQPTLSTDEVKALFDKDQLAHPEKIPGSTTIDLGYKPVFCKPTLKGVILGDENGAFYHVTLTETPSTPCYTSSFFAVNKKWLTCFKDDLKKALIDAADKYEDSESILISNSTDSFPEMGEMRFYTSIKKFSVLPKEQKLPTTSWISLNKEQTKNFIFDGKTGCFIELSLTDNLDFDFVSETSIKGTFLKVERQNNSVLFLENKDDKPFNIVNLYGVSDLVISLNDPSDRYVITQENFLYYENIVFKTSFEACPLGEVNITLDMSTGVIMTTNEGFSIGSSNSNNNISFSDLSSFADVKDINLLIINGIKVPISKIAEFLKSGQSLEKLEVFLKN